MCGQYMKHPDKDSIKNAYPVKLVMKFERDTTANKRKEYRFRIYIVTIHNINNSIYNNAVTSLKLQKQIYLIPTNPYYAFIFCKLLSLQA